jgi:hypothetical protein
LEIGINDYSTRKEGTAGDSNTKGGTKSISFQNHILQLAWGMFNVLMVTLQVVAGLNTSFYYLFLKLD